MEVLLYVYEGFKRQPVLDLFDLLKKPADILTLAAGHESVCVASSPSASNNRAVEGSSRRQAAGAEEDNQNTEDNDNDNGNAPVESQSNAESTQGIPSKKKDKTHDGKKVKIYIGRGENPDALKIQLEMPAFGIERSGTQDEMASLLGQLISELLGYKKCVLTEMTVRNDRGVKSKPEITVYLRNEICYAIPSRLKYCRDAAEAACKTHNKGVKNYTYSQEAFSTSEVLAPVLEARTTLAFTSETANVFILSRAKKANAFTVSANINPLKIFDGFLSLSPLRHFLSLLSPHNTPMKTRLYQALAKPPRAGQPPVFPWKMLSQLAETEIEHLKHILSYAPLFGDTRDLLVLDLIKHLNSRLKPVPAGKSDMFALYTVKLLSRRAQGSLRRLLDWQHNLHPRNN